MSEPPATNRSRADAQQPEQPASQKTTSSAPPPIHERGVEVRGQRLATAMNDAPREFLARAPLVMLPESGYPWQAYRAILERIGRERRVFALDWPGFGASAKPAPEQFTYDTVSYAEILAGWLDGLGLGRSVLLGNGLGGTVALRYAAAHPQRVLGLALVAPLGFATSAGVGRRLTDAATASHFVRRVVGGTLISLALGPSTQSTRALQEELRALRQKQSADARIAEHAATTALARNTSRSLPDIPPLASQLSDIPTMVLRGALDPVVTEAEAHRAAETLGTKGALEIVLPDAGHLPHLQQPARFFQALDGLITVAEMRALGG